MNEQRSSRSEVGGQKSEVKGQNVFAAFSPLTLTPDL